MAGRFLMIREDEIAELLTDKKLQEDTKSHLKDINYFWVISRRKDTFLSQNYMFWRNSMQRIGLYNLGNILNEWYKYEIIIIEFGFVMIWRIHIIFMSYPSVQLFITWDQALLCLDYNLSCYNSASSQVEFFRTYSVTSSNCVLSLYHLKQHALLISW